MQNNDLLRNTMTSTLDVIERASQNAEKLGNVLEREYRALMDRDITLINSLSSEKTALLDALSRLEPQLKVAYNVAEMEEGERSLQRLLQLCKDLNARNHSLLMIAIDQNRKSLSLLRSVLKLDQTSVYSANGELNADRSKRYLGNA